MLTGAFELLKAERRAWRMVLGHGPQNAKLARYYEVRMLVLMTYCHILFSSDQRYD